MRSAYWLNHDPILADQSIEIVGIEKKVMRTMRSFWSVCSMALCFSFSLKDDCGKHVGCRLLMLSLLHDQEALRRLSEIRVFTGYSP